MCVSYRVKMSDLSTVSRGTQTTPRPISPENHPSPTRVWTGKCRKSRGSWTRFTDCRSIRWFGRTDRVRRRRTNGPWSTTIHTTPPLGTGRCGSFRSKGRSKWCGGGSGSLCRTPGVYRVRLDVGRLSYIRSRSGSRYVSSNIGRRFVSFPTPLYSSHSPILLPLLLSSLGLSSLFLSTPLNPLPTPFWPFTLCISSHPPYPFLPPSPPFLCTS